MCGPLCCCVFTPLDTCLQNRGVEDSRRKNIVRAVTVVTAVSTAVFTCAGALIGIAIDDAMCPGHQCTGTTDAKSIFTAVLPFVGAFVGAIAPCIFVRLGGQVAERCMRRREYAAV